MNESEPLPAPMVVRRSRWWIALVWLVPLGAAVGAGFYYRRAREEHGLEVTVLFSDASGLRVNETQVSHLGVPVGRVIGLTLDDDRAAVRARVRLRESAGAFAKEGTKYWIVRPRISFESISGLGTIASGPYIEALPGTGYVTGEFKSLRDPPGEQVDGLNIVLLSERLDHLQIRAPLYYRGIEIGVVQDIRLSGDSRSVEIRVVVRRAYAPLIRQTSRFWVLKGADVKGGLLSGIQFKLDSVRDLVTGGINVATPDVLGPVAEDGGAFPLYDEPKKDWLEWSPRIAVTPPAGDEAAARQAPVPPAGGGAAQPGREGVTEPARP